MKPQDIQIGTRLELDILDKNYEKVGNTYVSQLLEIQKDDCLMISAPIYEARLIYIPLQSLIRLTFAHHKFGMLGFTATVLKKEYRGQIAIMIVKPDNELVKIQRRRYYRLDYLANILIWPEVKENKAGAGADAKDGGKAEAKPDEKAAVKAVTRNISGSGLCVISEVKYAKNTELNVTIDLGGTIIPVKCLVVRCNSFETNKGEKFEIGMHFSHISKKDQNYLVKYIFEQQRMLLKRESKLDSSLHSE